MKKTLLVLVFITISKITFSQNYTLEVLDSATNQPISNAHVTQGKEVYLSNDKGLVILVQRSPKKVEVSHVKYHSKFIELSDTKKVTVYLTENRSLLDEVTISSKRNLKKYIQFKSLPEIPKPIHSFGAVLKDNKLYTFGGDGSIIQASNKKGLSEMTETGEASPLSFLTRNKPTNFYKYRKHIFTYDFGKESWETKEIQAKPRAYHRAIPYKNEIYIVGGKSLSTSKKRELLAPQIEIFNTVNDSIIVDEMNPHQGVNSEALVFEDKLLVIGGSVKLKEQGGKEYSDKIHFYDFETGYWYLLTTMSKGKETSGIIIDHTLYLFGGNRNKSLTEIESFDLNTGKWRKEGDLFTAMEKPAITSYDKTIYLFEKDRLVTYHTNTKELREFRIELPFYFSEMFYLNDKLYIVGGTEKKEYQNTPQRNFVEISLDEFYTTSVKSEKVL